MYLGVPASCRCVSDWHKVLAPVAERGYLSPSQRLSTRRALIFIWMPRRRKPRKSEASWAGSSGSEASRSREPSALAVAKEFARTTGLRADPPATTTPSTPKRIPRYVRLNYVESSSSGSSQCLSNRDLLDDDARDGSETREEGLEVSCCAFAPAYAGLTRPLSRKSCTESWST